MPGLFETSDVMRVRSDVSNDTCPHRINSHTEYRMSDHINNPTEAGFIWELGEVSYDAGPKDRRSLGMAPHVRVLPDGVTKFEAAFPGLIAAALNGQSIKVRCQAATRRAILAARTDGGTRPTEMQLREKVLNALRGVRMSIKTVVFKDLDGNIHTNEDEARRSNIAILVGLGVPSDVAIAKVMGETVKTEEVVTEE